MLGKIIIILGWVAGILACIDILKSNHSLIERIIFIILLIATNWIGVIVHYLYGKSHL